MNVIEGTALIAAAPVVAGSLYLGGLGLLALLPSREAARPAGAMRRFAIIVPAHNEEAALPALFQSIDALDFPRNLISVVVVADNCDDATAHVARAGGATVLERRDQIHIGKGYALAYALARLTGDHDAVVFIDADCTVSPNLLRAFNDRVEGGEEVLQAYYKMQVDAASSTRLVRELALALVHRVRPRGKRWYGGSAGLKGSGMCFRRDAIERFGWTASGLAEDVEQHIRLVHAGVRVGFVEDATVTGLSPAALRDAASQHRRWEAGRAAAARSSGLPLLFHGIRQRSVMQVDAAVELLLPAVSVPAATVLGVTAIAVALRSAALGGAAAVSIAAMTVYLAAGVVSLHASAADVGRAMLSLPGYAAWKLRVYFGAMVKRSTAWQRSQREP